MMPNFEYMHSAEKARNTTLDDDKYSSQRNSVVITLTRGRHILSNKRALVLRTPVILVILLVVLLN